MSRYFAQCIRTIRAGRFCASACTDFAQWPNTAGIPQNFSQRCAAKSLLHLSQGGVKAPVQRTQVRPVRSQFERAGFNSLNRIGCIHNIQNCQFLRRLCQFDAAARPALTRYNSGLHESLQHFCQIRRWNSRDLGKCRRRAGLGAIDAN